MNKTKRYELADDDARAFACLLCGFSQRIAYIADVCMGTEIHEGGGVSYYFTEALVTR